MSSPAHPWPAWVWEEARLRITTSSLWWGCLAGSLGLPGAQMAKGHHTTGAGAVALASHHCWGKRTHQRSQPFGILQILTAQGVSQSRTARCSCSRVRAPLPWEAANLNWVHECQQVPWREEGRGDIGAAGGSIYSCFLKNPV